MADASPIEIDGPGAVEGGAPVLVAVPLEIVDKWQTQWGLVTVYDAGGKIARQYKITAEEVDAVTSSNDAGPPGCTREEWKSGRVIVEGKGLNPGQAAEQPDGSLLINNGVVEKVDAVEIDMRLLPAGKWANDADGVKVDAIVSGEILGAVDVVPLKG